MAIQMDYITKAGVTVPNAYLKIIRSMLLPTKPELSAGAKKAIEAGHIPAPPTTIWGEVLTIGVYASKALADANPGAFADYTTVAIADSTKVPQTGNQVKDKYTYLLTLPQFQGASSV